MDSCYDFTTTSAQSTMESTINPTTDTTSKADQCDQFLTGSCDIDESNTLDMIHDVSVGQCQDMCFYSKPCHWFTWYNVSGNRLSLLSLQRRTNSRLNLRLEISED